ncbi:MAG: hypothetical protein AAF458_05470 [Pseudomonadota bacterium]
MEEAAWIQLFARGQKHDREPGFTDVSALETTPAAALPDSAIVLVSMEEGSVAVRLMRLLLLRFQLHRIRQRLKAVGYVHLRYYFAYPDLDRPYLIAELESRALRYSRTHLVFNSRSRLKGLVVSVLTKISGCLPFAAGVIVVGSRR